MTEVDLTGPEGHLEAISGPSGDQSGGSFWRVILVNSEVILDPILRPILGNLINMLKLPSFGRG